MKVLRLKTGEKTAVNFETAASIIKQIVSGMEFVVAQDVSFFRADFQSIMPMAK